MPPPRTAEARPEGKSGSGAGVGGADLVAAEDARPVGRAPAVASGGNTKGIDGRAWATVLR
ncbi:hypothetical protein GCM10010341_34840 [Streptomyces noursei]|nr:hypothetical protein GCM10010341_34840 [Streptomyces noursei]